METWNITLAHIRSFLTVLMPNLLIGYECNYFEDTLINFEEKKVTRKNTTIVTSPKQREWTNFSASSAWSKSCTWKSKQINRTSREFPFNTIYILILGWTGKATLFNASIISMIVLFLLSYMIFLWTDFVLQELSKLTKVRL